MTARITDLEGRLDAALKSASSKETARTKILQRLALADLPLPIHSLDIPGVSQTSASARLREMAREGLVVKYPVKGKHFDAWALTPESDYEFKTYGPKGE